MTEFVIEWEISDDEWERSREVTLEEPPGGLFDHARLALNFMLNGIVQFRANDQTLFPADRLLRQWQEGSAEAVALGDEDWGDPDPAQLRGFGNISVLDVAWKLHMHINPGGFRTKPDGSRVVFQIEDGDLRFVFDKRAGSVSIRSNLFRDEIELFVPEPAFYDGVNRFLETFVREVQSRLPVLLAWETFDDLRAFVPDRGERQRYPRSGVQSGAWYRSVTEGRNQS